MVDFMRMRISRGRFHEEARRDASIPGDTSIPRVGVCDLHLRIKMESCFVQQKETMSCDRAQSGDPSFSFKVCNFSRTNSSSFIVFTRKLPCITSNESLIGRKYVFKTDDEEPQLPPHLHHLFKIGFKDWFVHLLFEQYH
ncbi:hypothetical protein Pfo_003813 [Paulownia fortunei]|nr:hypothetical protein Pfo_003813 [Paulownia fortunei]